MNDKSLRLSSIFLFQMPCVLACKRKECLCLYVCLMVIGNALLKEKDILSEVMFDTIVLGEKGVVERNRLDSLD